MDKDEYKINVDVSGILFYPIPTQTVTFTKSIEDVPESSDSGGGCLIATAAFGSELSTQVQQLRETRDNKLMTTDTGNTFMNFFNKYYYSFSPMIADYERENPLFREAVKIFITPMIHTLTIINHVDIDSEEKIIFYGVGIIVLNSLIYVIIPIFVIIKIREQFKMKIHQV